MSRPAYVSVTRSGLVVRAFFDAPALQFGDDAPIPLPCRGLYLVAADQPDGDTWAVCQAQADEEHQATFLLRRRGRSLTRLAPSWGIGPVWVTPTGHVAIVEAASHGQTWSLDGVSQAIPPAYAGTSQGFAWVEDDGTAEWRDQPRPVIAGQVAIRHVTRGGWTVWQAADGSDRVWLYRHDTRALYLAADVYAPVGPQLTELADGSAAVAISLARTVGERIVYSRDLTPVETPAPEPTPAPPLATGFDALTAWPRKLFVSPYYSYSARYGCTDDPIGNAITLVEETDGDGRRLDMGGMVAAALAAGAPLIVGAGMADLVPDDRVFAWLVAGATLDALGDAVIAALQALPQKPIVAYLDRSGWPDARPAWLTPRVWPSLQCFRDPAELLTAFIARVGADVARVSTYGQPFALTPQTFDRNGQATAAEARETLDAVEAWTRQEEHAIVLLQPFADRRPGGMTTYPSLRAWVRAAALAVAARPNRHDAWEEDRPDRLRSLQNKLGQSTPLISLSPADKAFILEALK